MELIQLDRVNRTYVLARNKEGENIACTAINQGFYSLATSDLVCKFKDKTRWRYFKEASYCRVPSTVKPGDRVSLPDERGNTQWFFVLSVSMKKDEDGNRNAIAAI